MPPSPAYNLLCVLCSAANILSHAARYRASQVGPATHQGWKRAGAIQPEANASIVFDNPPRHTSSGGTENATKKHPRAPEEPSNTVNTVPTLQPRVSDSGQVSRPHAGTVVDVTRNAGLKDAPDVLGPEFRPPPSVVDIDNMTNATEENVVAGPALTEIVHEALSSGLVQMQTDHSAPGPTLQEPVTYTRNLQASKVPSSRIGRLFHYGGLAASLGYGAASEMLRRTGNDSGEQQSSVMMTEANVKRLVDKLSQMRGAALKLGQFLSIQDTHVLPADVDKLFRRVQDSAHYMPDWQMEKVMSVSLGPNWAASFSSFDRIPFAAASIGQVHTAVLDSSVSPSGNPEPVAVKIQFPNIAKSIESDLGYIKLLLTAGSLLPKGLFLDRTIQVMKEELADECNYTREASFLSSFGSPTHLGGDKRFKVPWVWSGSTDQVLVMERVNGTSVGDADTNGLDQRDRDDIASWIMELCLKELFEFRTMQTDPNWSNFLWNKQTRQVELIDFGATREYSKEFMDAWLRLLQAAASEDRDACVQWSLKLGYLTGQENQIMLDAHINSMILLATPFRSSVPQPFEFGQGSKWSDITADIRAQIPVMLAHRLTPPPKETYSLNRKLSGTFLLASRLGASVDTKAIWDRVVDKYEFD